MNSEISFKNSIRRETIDLSSGNELSYWAKAISISEEELRRVVKKVGPVLRNVMREVILQDIRRSRI